MQILIKTDVESIHHWRDFLNKCKAWRAARAKAKGIDRDTIDKEVPFFAHDIREMIRFLDISYKTHDQVEMPTVSFEKITELLDKVSRGEMDIKEYFSADVTERVK